MLKVVVLAFALFWLARLLGRLIPRIEVRLDHRPNDDARVYAVMREHFPDRYEAYRSGLLSENEERRLLLDCVEILGAREEIERL